MFCSIYTVLKSGPMGGGGGGGVMFIYKTNGVTVTDAHLNNNK